jgi:superfamily II DNA or RNA helicase
MRQEIEMRYISDVVKEDYKNWDRGSIVFISSPTGSGKSTFILEKLLPEAQRQKKYLIYVSNRKIIDSQIKSMLKSHYQVEDVRRGEENHYFVGLTYQYCEKTQQLPELHLKKKGKKLTSAQDYWYDHPYDLTISKDDILYYVFDECHYIISDAHFNNSTNYWSMYRMRTSNATTVCLSATPESLYGYLFETLCNFQNLYLYSKGQINKPKNNCMECLLIQSDIYEKDKANYRRYLEQPINLDFLRMSSEIFSIPLNQSNNRYLPPLNIRSYEEVQDIMKEYPYTNQCALEYFHEATCFSNLRDFLYYEFGVNAYEYTFEPDYSYFDCYYFDEYQELYKEIEKTVDKWLVFVNDGTEGTGMVESLTSKGISAVYIDSKTKSSKNRYAKRIYKGIVDNGTFPCRVLVTTSVMECGVTLKDEAIKNIVISQSSKASFLQMLGRVRRQSEEERIRLMIRRINFQTVKVNFDHNESALRFMSEFFRLQTKTMKDNNLHKRLTDEIQSKKMLTYLYPVPPNYFWRDVPFREYTLNRAAYWRLLYDQSYIVQLMKQYEKNDSTFYLREQLRWLSQEYSEERWVGFEENKEALCSYLADIQRRGPILQKEEFQRRCLEYISSFQKIYMDDYLWGMVRVYRDYLENHVGSDKIECPGKDKLNDFFEKMGIPYTIKNPEVWISKTKRKRAWVIEDI